MKARRFLGAALAALLTTSAIAQVNTVPQVGVMTGVVTWPTYTAVSIGLVPAASATDFFCISGSASRTIYVNKIRVSGVAGTAITAPVTLLRRTSLDTGGTAATTTANPANTIARVDTATGAPTATLIAYTANPTINDTSPTYIATSSVPFPTAATIAGYLDETWHWESNDFEGQPILRGASQQFCLNLNATSISAGVLQVSINWSEL